MSHKSIIPDDLDIPEAMVGKINNEEMSVKFNSGCTIRVIANMKKGQYEFIMESSTTAEEFDSKINIITTSLGKYFTDLNSQHQILDDLISALSNFVVGTKLKRNPHYKA